MSRNGNTPPPLVDPSAFRLAGGIPPAGPPTPGPSGPGGPGERWRDLRENTGLRTRLAGEVIGRVALGSVARLNERVEDNQADRIALGETAMSLLHYEPADPATGTPARITGSRNFADREGVRNDLRDGIFQAREPDDERGLGLRNSISTRIVARRVNKAISTHNKAARASQESPHKRTRPISRFRPLKGFGQREARRRIKDDLRDGNIDFTQARLRRQFLRDGLHADTNTGVIQFQRDLNEAGLQTHKGMRLVNRRERQNRPRLGLSRRTRKMHLGRRYDRLAERAITREENSGERAEQYRRRIDRSHNRTETLRRSLANNRGRTYEAPRQFVHGHTIHPRSR